MTDISIIIASNKKEKDIKCIQYLEEQRSKEIDLEIIVRNDPGLCSARNKGVGEASSDKLVFIDDDAIPMGNYINNIYSALEEHSVIRGRVLHPSDDVFKKIATHYDLGEKPKYTTNIVGCNMAFNRIVFDEIGYFDENISWGHDELDFIKRTLERYPVYYDPEVCVRHPYSDSLLDYWKKMHRMAKSDLYIHKKYDMGAEEQVLNMFDPNRFLHYNPFVMATKVVGNTIRISRWTMLKISDT